MAKYKGMLAKVAARAKVKKEKNAKRASSRKAKKEKAVPVRIVHDSDDSSVGVSSYQKERDEEKKENGGFDKYELESACTTLDKADKIRKNKKLLQACLDYHSRQHEKISTLAGLKKRARDSVKAMETEEYD